MSRLVHFEGGTWVDATTSLDTLNKVVCATVTSLSPFAVFESVYSAAIQPPVSADGSSVFNGNRGSVPVKFALSANGLSTCQLPPATIALTRTSGTAPGTVNQSDYTLPSDAGSSFRIDSSSCQYTYNLGTKSLIQGTYLVQIIISRVAVGTGVFGLQ
jgi:hypothetical protein